MSLMPRYRHRRCFHCNKHYMEPEGNAGIALPYCSEECHQAHLKEIQEWAKKNKEKILKESETNK